MKNIKIIGAIIFLLSIILAVLFNFTTQKNQKHIQFINSINSQKSFTQDISKNIFYIYKNKEISTKKLDDSIDKFILNMKTQIKSEDKDIIQLWNTFYLDVQNFRDFYATKALYSNIILEKIVTNIYNTNLKLIVKFNKLINIKKKSFNDEMLKYKYLQYFLFSSLLILLLYLFTQLKTLISFIQKFLTTSKAIITDSSIKKLEPIKLDRTSTDILEASQNFNTLVKKINNSINDASDSILHSCKSLELLDNNIENLTELIYIMNNEKIDSELNKKEDAVIQTLDELNSTKQKLFNLQTEVDNLITHSINNQT